MLDRLRNLIIRESDKPRAQHVLFAVSFVESSFFPIPPDALLAPMVLRQPQHWLRFVVISTLGSVLGGLLGYAIGYFLVDTIGQWLVQSYGLEGGLERFQDLFKQYGAEIILLKGLTPIPYKLVTIASGVAHYPLLPFVVLSLITRAGRFLLIAALMRFLSPPARAYVEKRLVWFLLGFLLIAGGASMLAVKYM